MDDVLIVGGGHVGLYTAFKLAQAGLQVRLFDQKRAVGEHIVCTGIVSEEAFEKFDLPEATILGRIQHVRFFSPSKHHFFDYTPSQPLARIVDRPRFNQYFAEKAVLQGAVIQTGSRIEEIRINQDKITVQAVENGGPNACYEAQVLILATGVNYKLFEGIGIKPAKNFLGGAQIHIPYENGMWTSIYVGREVAPGAFAWIVPLERGMARVGLLSEKNPAQYLKDFLDEIRPSWREEVGENGIDLRPVVQGPLEKSFADRVVVVGEAAGQIKTTTGGGIYYGLLGAEIAIDALKKAFRNQRFTADVFTSYDRRWKRAIGEELRLGYYFRKLFSKLTDEQIEELFDRIIREEILNLAHRRAEFDWHRGFLLSIFKIPPIRRILHTPF